MDRTPASLAPPTGDPQNPGGFTHIPALDGIRGLAILMVLFVHLFWANTATGSRIFDFFTHVRESCYIGVNLFFVLSGFLITGILIDTLNIPHYFKTFYARRALRIFPLYYGVLIVLLLLTRPLHFIWSGWQYYFLTYSANLALWRNAPLVLPHININHFWSLQVEEQFYLVWPFLVYKLKRPQSLLRVSLIGCVLVLCIRIALVAMHSHFSNEYLVYSPTFSCADNLLFGCGLCALLRTSARQRVIELAPRVFAVGAIILVVVGITKGSLDWQHSFFIPTFGFTLIGITFAALITMALRTGSTTQRIFQNKGLRFFGKYSYGLYVFHYSIAETCSPLVRKFVDDRFHSKALGVISGAAVVLALSLIAALLSYRFYEEPFLKLKRYFSYNRKTTRQPAIPG